MSDLSVATDRTPLLERQSGYGTQSGQEEVRNESLGTRIYNALAWFFNLINPFSCCMSSAQDVEGSGQSDAMERGELASRVALPPPRDVLEGSQVQEKKYEIIDLGGGHSLKLEIRPQVPISSGVEVQRRERVVAKPVDFPVERAHIRKLEKEVKKLESQLAEIDRELANPRLKKTSTFEISKMLEAQSTMGELVDVLGVNRRIDELTWQRPAVQRKLDIARDDLQDFREMVNLPEVV
jgi:hypothetical protein